MGKITIYTSSAGGTFVEKDTNSVKLILTKHSKDIALVNMDLEPDATKQKVWSKSGKKGVYPLVFNGDTYIGTKEEIDDLNEDGQLADKCK